MTTASASSLLERLLDLLQASGPLRACFDDLSGFTFDYPEFALPLRLQIHDCGHCRLAKESGAFNRGRYTDCTLNKRAANALARRGAGFHGLCHAGLLEIVEPLSYHGVTLGVLYYGQVSVRERHAESLRRIDRYCRRRKIDPAPFHDAFARVPVVAEGEIAGHRERLRTVVETLRLLCESLAVPVERYRIAFESAHWRSLDRQPPLVRTVGEYIHKHYGEPCRVSDLARRFQCHPNYLGALFRKSMGLTLNDYVNHIRVERAKHLLRTGRLGVSEVGYQCGFSDPSHFGKVFRQALRVTPLAYRKSFEKDQSHI